ncbi:hypothetical protein CS8_000190 [Cupriavidus sp. 8B]
MLRLARREISRFPRKERPCVPGSWTTPGRRGTRVHAPLHVAFRVLNRVGTRNNTTIAARWLARTFPYRRFADHLTVACARLGADVVRYSFIAVDFHHLLLTGLPAHSELVTQT